MKQVSISKAQEMLSQLMKDWRVIRETLYLLSVPGMRESIREGLQTPVDECSTELPW